METKIYQRLADIVPVITAHGEGQKFVFLSKEDSETALTQFAYGKLMPGEIIAEHFHATMEECFFFIKGIGNYTISGIAYPLGPGTFIRIPTGTPHQLEAAGNEALEFVYFGVATP